MARNQNRFLFYTSLLRSVKCTVDYCQTGRHPEDSENSPQASTAFVVTPQLFLRCHCYSLTHARHPVHLLPHRELCCEWTKVTVPPCTSSYPKAPSLVVVTVECGVLPITLTLCHRRRPCTYSHTDTTTVDSPPEPLRPRFHSQTGEMT